MEYGISGYRTDYRYVKKQVIELAHGMADLSGKGSQEQVYLLGTKEGDNLIFSEITLVVENGQTGEKQFYPIPTSKGMGGGIDLVDFNHDGLTDIGVYIRSGGSGNELTYYLFFNEDDGQKLAFNSRQLENKMKYEVEYLPKYQVNVKNLTTNEASKLDLSQRDMDYLSAIYDEHGELKQAVKGVVANVSDSNSIHSHLNEVGHDLLFTQRILGRSHNDTIGYVQSYIGFDDGQYHVYKVLVSQ